MAVLVFDLGVMLARVFAGAGGDFAGEQVHDWAVLVGGPDGSVAAEKRRAGGFFADETERAVEEASDKPLEPDGHFIHFSFHRRGDAINDAAADERLADHRVRW